MRFAQYLRLEQGSNTVGFALIAPLLVGSFLAITQIANVVNVQTAISAAAKSGAREASRYDSSLDQGVIVAERILANQGISKVNQLEIHRTQINGVQFVELVISKNYQIPWINFVINLDSVGQSVDEKFI